MEEFVFGEEFLLGISVKGLRVFFEADGVGLAVHEDIIETYDSLVCGDTSDTDKEPSGNNRRKGKK